ncbi:YhgE/Pip family protein [Neobacillus cucumis]|uniref:YhgE/Pip domain-containing protein n=1 Tax=Neobacillus cucumis TaxID=1740721 RepID=A0A2N5H933_9BACI|nr:YhgE/Pip domain-containing protein [Neobacillus cucumis]PLS02021.1 YhgE/Pip domain-containing protein [Neobacillus cucumis]
MKGFKLVFRDLKMMWHHKHGRIALIFLLIVPLIYAGFFLAGYWNPYGKLDQLPVAVVNLDKGSTMDKKAINAGHDFVQNLKENKDLNFHFISEKKANKGINDGTYYMVITIPQDFSQKVSTLMDEHPEPAKLMYKINPGKNYVASQISTTATEKMKTKIANSITKSYADGVFSKFQELANGLRDAGNGAAKINKGTTDAKNGMVLLSDGVHSLNNGAAQLMDGSQQLTIGQDKLTKGVNVIKDGSASLSDGMSNLAAGHTSLETGINKLAQSTKEIAAGQEQLAKGQANMKNSTDDLNNSIEQFLQHHPELTDDAAFQQITAKADGLSVAADSLSNGQNQLVQGTSLLVQGESEVQDGMRQFGSKLKDAASGATKLASGTVEFSNGFTQWKQGFTSLNNGIIELANGGNKLDQGTNQLVDGLGQLSAGSNELAVKLDDAAKKTASVHNTDQLTSMFSEPVQLVESEVSDVPNYGTGIMPYFLSLAFYVGGIMAANILPLGRRQDIKVNGTVHFINKLALKYVIALIQVLFVDLIVLFGFKVDVANVPLFILSSIIVSFTFMTFILMLVTVFGVAGKFMAVTLLVLQLATCGGTFPGELSNPILSKIGNVLPMAHSLRGFQDVITLGDWMQLQQQIFILLIYLIAAAVIGWITSHLQHSKTEAVQ